jgi:hypothetical protein
MREPAQGRRRSRWRLLRDVLIAAAPTIEVLVLVAGLATSIDAPSESERDWAPLAWPLRATVVTFPLALAAVAVAVGLRSAGGRTAAIWLAGVSAAIGVLPFVAAVRIALHLV